jgi:hypothetical protein
MMSVDQLVRKVNNHEVIAFTDVIATIDATFTFVPSAFKNGNLMNDEGMNNGSCKVFSFAKMQELNETDTLFLFGEHYQKVLETPTEEDHQNIRNFMQFGWDGIHFEKIALV